MEFARLIRWRLPARTSNRICPAYRPEPLALSAGGAPGNDAFFYLNYRTLRVLASALVPAPGEPELVDWELRLEVGSEWAAVNWSEPGLASLPVRLVVQGSASLISRRRCIAESSHQ